MHHGNGGPVNEALSDIFGAFIERATLGRSDRTFLAAEGTGEAIRDMRHPTRTGMPDAFGSLSRLVPGQQPGQTNDDGGCTSTPRS